MTRIAAAREDLVSEMSPDLRHGRRVLQLESAALAALASVLDSRFADAVGLLVAVEGRVVVSGMGKSGHVARKIAATLASTGTPAQFVHPAEASHGDMGAITRKDALLLLSNSGETVEIGDLVGLAKRYSIPLVGIAGCGESMLTRSADVGLVLPDVAEACPMGLAPTTSTTMMLGLGDALAVALMERRGFTVDEYRLLHPGGALGRALIRVQDIMHTGDDMPLVQLTSRMREILIEMTAKRLGCVGVVDEEGSLAGIFTDGDLARCLSQGKFDLDITADAIMTHKPWTVRASALAAEAVGFMNTRPNRITSLFVLSDDDAEKGRAAAPVGFLHMHDCLRVGIS